MKNTQIHSKNSRSQGNRDFHGAKADSDTFFSKNKNSHSFFSPLQPKLIPNQPDDKYEAEADTSTDKIEQRLDQPEPITPVPFFNSIDGSNPVQLKCEECEKEEQSEEEEEKEPIQPLFQMSSLPSAEDEIQRNYLEDEENIQTKKERKIRDKESHPGDNSSLEQRLRKSKSDWNPIPEAIQNSMETAFGADFSDVKIHTGSNAIQMNQELNAHAFTHGRDIYFNRGKFAPDTSKGRHLLAHELTHVVQQRKGVDQVQRFVPDHEKITRGIKLPKAHDLNRYFWDAFKLEELKPLREYNPIDTPNAYANQTLKAQKIIKKSKNIPALYGKKIWTDGILGSETLIFLRFISVSEELASERFEIAGLGFDLEALASVQGLIQARKAFVALFLPEFLVEWRIKAPGEPVIEHLARDKEIPITEQWFDSIIFGGPPPPNISKDFDLGDRFAILKKAYKDQTFDGIAGLVEVQRGFLNNREDSKIQVERDKGTRENLLWITYSAENKSRAEELENRFGITYPDQKARDIRDTIGKKKTGKFKEKLTGLLLSFYIPERTDQERIRLRMVAEKYLLEKSESIEGFIQPRAEELIKLIENREERSYLLAHKIKRSLGAFIGRPELFEKLAEFLKNHERQDYFKFLLLRTQQLKSISALERLIRLCMQTRFKDHETVIEALETLKKLKKSVTPHEYIAGPPKQQGVKLGSGQFLRVGDVTTGMYRITETRQQIKEARRKELEDKMRELAENHMADSLNSEGDSGQNMTEEEFMEMILEKAQQEVKITEDDMLEVKYEEAFRLKEVASRTVDGIEEFQVAYEKVFRTGGKGEWEVLEPNSGLRNQQEFEERLAWFKFANMMDTVETVVSVGAVIAGGVVLLTSGAASGLIALGGGAKMVGLSVGISVLIWAITADRLTLEGFLKAVLEGYLMAVGLRLFAPAGAAAARFVGTATFKQKLLRILLRGTVIGGGSGALTGAGTLLAEDLIRGRLRSPGQYLKAAATGFLLGAVFELGGSLILGPIFRTAGRNTLERITNIGSLKQFLTDAGVNLKNINWGSEVNKSFAVFNKWLNTNLDKKLAQQIAAEAKEKAKTLLRSFGEGFELTVHREALDLIELGMNKEAIDGLEKLIRVAGRNLDKKTARGTIDKILNELVSKPARANAYMSIVKAADDALLKELAKGNGLNELAVSDTVLNLAKARPPIQVAHLLELRFNGNVIDFESWARGLNAQSKDVQNRVLDILNTRGASVTHESVLRMAQSGAAMSDSQIGGLARMVNKSRSSGIGLDVFDDFIRHIPDDKVGVFLQSMNHYPAPDFADMMKLVDDPARAGRLLKYVEDPDQLLRMYQAGGKNLDNLDNLFQATRGRPKAPKEMESLLAEYGGDANTLKQAVAQVDGDAPLLQRTINNVGTRADVDEILAEAASHPSTSSDPASLRKLLQIAEKEAQHDKDVLKKFISQVEVSQTGAIPTTFDTAIKRLNLLVKNHPKAMFPFKQGSKTTLARADSFEDIVLSGGTTRRINISEFDLYHYKKGHIVDKFSFSNKNLPPKRKSTTFWPVGTTDDLIMSHAKQALKDPKVAAILQSGSGFEKTTVKVGSFEYQVGIDMNSDRLVQFFPLGTNGGAIPTSGDVLMGIKKFFSL